MAARAIVLSEEPGLSARVELPGTGLTISRLGYGTSMLMSRLNRRQSVRLVRAALDAGITHFDTARLYGHGEAESALGEALRGTRERVTITTKVGILPPKQSVALSVARQVARKLVALQPGLRKRFRRAAEGLRTMGVFHIPTIAASLETSLRQLGTEYVDILLLHECREEDLAREELLDFLERARSAGKIRQFGLASSPSVTEAALLEYPRYTPVLQFANSLFEPNLEKMGIPPDRGVLTHSALSAGVTDLWSMLETNARVREMWSRQLGINCGDRHAVAAMLLQYAAVQNRNGGVLFASANERNIAASARALEVPYSSAQLKTLSYLVDHIQRPAMESLTQ